MERNSSRSAKTHRRSSLKSSLLTASAPATKAPAETTAAPPPVLNDPLMYLPEVEKAVRKSGTTIWRMEAVGKFPRRHKHGRNAVWFRSEIIAYLEAVRAETQAPPAPEKANQARREAAAQRRAA